ncbi:MAG: tetratricopeptide repeat protein [Bacteroidales bacterium]|nr:tetratricopeptide repeat protein [Bacteroidales bacterium]
MKKEQLVIYLMLFLNSLLFQSCVSLTPEEKNVKMYSKEIKNNPQNISAFYNRAQAYYNSKNYENALADFSTVLEMDENFTKAAECNTYIGMIQMQAQDYTNAEFSFREAIEIDPNLYLANANFGKLFQDKGDYDSAEKYYDIALASSPNDKWVLEKKGEIDNLRRIEKENKEREERLKEEARIRDERRKEEARIKLENDTKLAKRLGFKSANEFYSIPEITVSQIMRDYAANEMGAERKYVGKIFKVVGTVYEIRRSRISNAPLVTLEGSDNFLLDFACYFGEGDLDLISSLRSGQRIKLIGTIAGKFSLKNIVYIEN